MRRRATTLSAQFDSQTRTYTPTQLGMATFASTLSPKEVLRRVTAVSHGCDMCDRPVIVALQAFFLHEELSRAMAELILEGDLHILYQLTPLNHGLEPSWQRLLEVAPDDPARS